LWGKGFVRSGSSNAAGAAAFGQPVVTLVASFVAGVLFSSGVGGGDEP
jgi:hypothetical protein